MLDLHMHTCFSDDGEYQPQEIMEMCKAENLKYFALSDHNSVKGCRQLEGKTEGIQMIPAIELDCLFEGKEFHLLGYGIDIHNEVYDDIENMVVAQEIQNSVKRVKFAREELQLDFTDEEINSISKRGIIAAEHIMEACINNHRNDDKEVMQPYLYGERNDNPCVNFYWDYFADGKPGHNEMKYPMMKLYVNMIHEQGGIAVLAHPGITVKEDQALLDGILALGIDGIEVYSSYHNEEQVKYYREEAKKHQLLITCGSDFHGKTKPMIQIGQCKMREEEYKILENKLNQWIR